MASVIEDAASSVAMEAFDELVGQSKRKWAVVLLAFIIGGVVTAVVAVRLRKRSDGAAMSGPDADLTMAQPSESRGVDPSTASAWSRRRAQIAHTDAAMRARVGRAASQLNIRRQMAAGRELDG